MSETFVQARDNAVRIAKTVLPDIEAERLVYAILRAALLAQREVLHSESRAQHTGKNEQ